MSRHPEHPFSTNPKAVEQMVRRSLGYYGGVLYVHPVGDDAPEHEFPIRAGDDPAAAVARAFACDTGSLGVCIDRHLR